MGSVFRILKYLLHNLYNNSQVPVVKIGVFSQEAGLRNARIRSWAGQELVLGNRSVGTNRLRKGRPSKDCASELLWRWESILKGEV